MSNVGVHLTLTRFGISNEEQRKARARSSSSSREPRSPDPVRQGKKRRRDNSASSFGDAAPPLADENFERDSDFWFEDGNIILVAQSIGFCVYKGPLIKHSPVFRDMLSLPQDVDSSTPHTPSGPPIVHLQDHPNDVRYFLDRFCFSNAFQYVAAFLSNTVPR